jgi:hypothetical protein
MHACTFSGVGLVAAIGEQREGAGCTNKICDRELIKEKKISTASGLKKYFGHRELIKEIFWPATAEAIDVYGMGPNIIP